MEFSAYKLPASCFVLLVAAFVAFGAVIPGEFVVDDRLWANPQLSSSAGAVQILQAFGTWVFRPLHAVFMNAALGLLGARAPAFHALSIALHALNSVLLFLVLGRLLPGLAVPMRLAATLSFVVHPAGSEAVLWISAMSELTVMAAMLTTFIFYLDWHQAWSTTRLAAIGVLFFVACLFKETALMLPLLVVSYEWAQKGRRLPGPLIVAAFVAPVVFLLVRQVAIGSFSGGQPLSANPVRVMELALAHLRFIWLPAAPPFALRPPEVALASPQAVATALATLGVLVSLCWRLKADRGVLVLGMLWSALALWPALAVAAVGEGFFNGRQAYIASAGLPILLAALLDRLPGRQGRAVLALLCGAFLWMLYATAGNALAWRSNLDVYRQAIAVSPAADGPRAGVADALLERGDKEGALSMYAEALARASSPNARGEYLYAMASILGQSGRNAESEKLLRQLLELEPENSFAWVGLGNNAWVGGRIGEAADHYRRAIDLNPGNSEAVSNLAGMLAAGGPAYAAEAARWQARARILATGKVQPQRRLAPVRH